MITWRGREGEGGRGREKEGGRKCVYILVDCIALLRASAEVWENERV